MLSGLYYQADLYDYTWSYCHNLIPLFGLSSFALFLMLILHFLVHGQIGIFHSCRFPTRFYYYLTETS